MTDTNPFTALEQKITQLENSQQEILTILHKKRLNELLSYQQLSSETGLAVQTLRQKKSSGVIPYIIVAGAVRFRRSDVFNFLNNKS